MWCAHCEAEFEPKNARGRFCSDRCRAAAWQRQRKDALALVEDQLTRALVHVRALRGYNAEA
jgi:predicted nucleic acid-binding Zn ribbon protein